MTREEVELVKAGSILRLVKDNDDIADRDYTVGNCYRVCHIYTDKSFHSLPIGTLPAEKYIRFPSNATPGPSLTREHDCWELV